MKDNKQMGLTMDQRAFVFATRGNCIKGKQCQRIALKNQIYVCIQNNIAYFPFMHCPLVGNQKWRWSIGPIQSFMSFY